MKPGDIIIQPGKVGYSSLEMSISDTRDHLVIIEGEADIKGCILAKDQQGEIHCINPKLFEVLYTLEEVVAKKMLEPDVMKFKPVDHAEMVRRIYDSIGRAMALDLDNEIMNSMLPTASSKGAKVVGKIVGLATGNEE
jgi:hypothetical protein